MEDSLSVPTASAAAVDPLMLYNLGEYYYQQGNLVEAEKAYLASGIPAAYNNLGVIAHARADYAQCARCWMLSGTQDAVSNLEKLLDEQKRSSELPELLSQINSPAALHRLAKWHLQSGDIDRAEEYLRLSNSKEAFTDLGVLMLQKGKLDEAELCFCKGVNVFFNLGVFFGFRLRPPRVADAELCFKKAATPAAYWCLGLLYESKNEMSRALLAYAMAGTEKAWHSAALLYVRNGHWGDAEGVWKGLYLQEGSTTAGYYLKSMLDASENRKRRDLSDNLAEMVSRLPSLSPQELLKQYDIHLSYFVQHVFARASTDVPSIGELKRRAQVELYAKKRFIRISTFDAEDREQMMAIVPEEELGGVDVYLAAFRIRMSSSQAGHDKNQDIEVVEYEAGHLKDASWRHRGKRLDPLRRRQVQIRDWLIFGCSCTPRNGMFKSNDVLPIDSLALEWCLRALILHPSYQMQSLELKCSDGVVKTVYCGVIRPSTKPLELLPLDEYDEQWRIPRIGRGGKGRSEDRGDGNQRRQFNNNNNNNSNRQRGDNQQHQGRHYGNKDRRNNRDGNNPRREGDSNNSNNSNKINRVENDERKDDNRGKSNNNNNVRDDRKDNEGRAPRQYNSRRQQGGARSGGGSAAAPTVQLPDVNKL